MRDSARQMVEQDAPKKNINASKLVPIVDWDEKVVWAFVKQAGGTVIGPVEIPHDKVSSYAGKLTWLAQEAWYYGKIDPTTHEGHQDVLPVTWTPGEPFPKEVPAKPPVAWAVLVAYQPLAASPGEVEIANKVKPQGASPESEGSFPVVPGELEDTKKPDTNGFSKWKVKATGELLSLLPGDKLAFWSSTEGLYHYARKTDSGWEIDFSTPSVSPEELDVKKVIVSSLLPKGFVLPPGYSITHAEGGIVLAKTPKGTAVKWMEKTHGWSYMNEPWKAHNPGEEPIDHAKKVSGPEPQPQTIATTPPAPEPVVLPAVPSQTATQPAPSVPLQQPNAAFPKGFELPKGYSLTSVTPKAVFAKTPGGVAVKWVVKLRSWWFVDQPGKEHRPGEDGVGADLSAPVQSAPPPPPPKMPATPPPSPEEVKPPEPPKPVAFVVPAGAPANPKGFQISGPSDKHGLWPLEKADGDYDDGHWYVHQDGTVYHHSPALNDYSPAVYGAMGWGLNPMEVPVPGAALDMKKFYGAAPKVPEGFVKYGYDPHGLLLIAKGSSVVVLLPNGLRATWQEKAQAYKLEDGTYLKVSDVKAGNFGTKKREVTVAENPEDAPHYVTYTGKVDENGFPLVDEYSEDPEDESLITGLTLLPDERVARWFSSAYQPYKYVEVTYTLKVDKKAPSVSVDEAKELLKTLGLTVKDGRYHKVLDSHKVYDPAFPAGFEPVTPVEGEVGLVPVRQVETNKRFYMLPGDLVASDTTGELKKFDVFGITQDGLTPKEEYAGLSLAQVVLMTKGIDPTAPKHTQLIDKTDKNGYPMVRTRPDDPDSSDELSLLPNGAVAKWDKNKKKYIVWEWDTEFKDFTPDVTHSYSLKQVIALQAKKLPGMPKAVSAVKSSQAVAKKPDPEPVPEYALEDTQNLDENGYSVHKHLLTGKLFSFLPTSQPTLGIWMSQMQAYRMVDWDPAAKSYTIAWKDEQAIWYIPGEPDVYVGTLETGGKKKVAKNPPAAQLMPATEKDPNGYEQGYHKPSGPASLETPMGPYSHLPNAQLGKWDPGQHIYQLVAYNAETGMYSPIPDPNKGGMPKTFIPPGKMSTTGSLPLGIFLPDALPEEWDKLNVTVHKDENDTPAVMLPNGMLVQVPIDAAAQFVLKTSGGFVPLGESLSKSDFVRFLKTIPLVAASSLHPLGKADPNQMPLFEPNLQPGVLLSLLPNGVYAVWDAKYENYSVWNMGSKGAWFQAKPATTYTKAITLPGANGYVTHVDKLQAFKSGAKKVEDESKLTDVPGVDPNGLKIVKSPSGKVLSVSPAGKILRWNEIQVYYEVYEFVAEKNEWLPKIPSEVLYPSEVTKKVDPATLTPLGKLDLNGFPKYQGVNHEDLFVKLPDGQFAEYEQMSQKYIPVVWEGVFWKRYYGKALTVDQAKASWKSAPDVAQPVTPAEGPPDPKKPDGFDQVEDMDQVDKRGLPMFLTKQGLKLSWLPNGKFAIWTAANQRYSVRELTDDTWLPPHPVVKYTLDEVLAMVEAHGPFKPNSPKAMYKGTAGPIPYLGHEDDLGLPAYESGDVDIDMYRLPDGTWVLWDDDANKYYKIEQNPSGAWAMVYPDVIFTKKDVMDMISKEAVKKAPVAPTQPQIVSVKPAALSPDHPDILPDPNGPDQHGVKSYIHKDQQGSKFATPVVWHPAKKTFYCLVGKSYVLAKWIKSAQKGDWNFYFDEDLDPDEMKAATADPNAPPAGQALPPGVPEHLEPYKPTKHGFPTFVYKFDPNKGKITVFDVVLLPSGTFVSWSESQGVYLAYEWDGSTDWWSAETDDDGMPLKYTVDQVKTLLAKGSSSPILPDPASEPGLPPWVKPWVDENGKQRTHDTGAGYYKHAKDPDGVFVKTPDGKFYFVGNSQSVGGEELLDIADTHYIFSLDSPDKVKIDTQDPGLSSDALSALLSAPTGGASKPGPEYEPYSEGPDANGFPRYVHKSAPGNAASLLPNGQFADWLQTTKKYSVVQWEDSNWYPVKDAAGDPLRYTLAEVQAMGAGKPTPATGPSKLGPEYQLYSGGEDDNGFPRYVRVDEDPDSPYPVTLLPNGEFARWLALSKLYQVMKWDSVPPPSWVKVYKPSGANLVYTLSEVEAMEAGKATPSTELSLGNLVKIDKTDKNGLAYYQDSKHPSFKLSLLPDGKTMGHWVSKKQAYQKMALQDDGSWESATFPITFITLADVEAMKIAMGHVSAATPPSTPLTQSEQGLSPTHPDIEKSDAVEDGFQLYFHKLNKYEKVVWAGAVGKFYLKAAKDYREVEWSPSHQEWLFTSNAEMLSVSALKALVAEGPSVKEPAFDPLGALLGLHDSLKALTANDPNGYPMAEVKAEPGKVFTLLPNGAVAKWRTDSKTYRKFEYDAADGYWSSSDPVVVWTLDQVKAMGSSSSAPVSDDAPGQEPADALVDTNFDWNPVPGIPDLKDLKYVGDGQALGYAGLGKKDIFEDPNTKQRFIFKPAIPKGGSKTELFRARIQEAYSAFALKVRPDHIPIKTVTYNGQVGTLQPELKVKTNTLKGAKPKSLTAQQREQLSVEHVIDWVMSQHDTHGDNVIITDDGRLLTIDKEQGFRYIFDKNQPDRLSTDYQPNDTTYTPYYNIFWKAFEKGEFDLDTKAMASAVAKVMSVDSQEYVKLITPYVESVFPNDPKKQDQFKKKALKRKLSARADFETFLTGLYKKRTGEEGKFRFETGWITKAGEDKTKYVTKTLQGESFVSWAYSEKNVKVTPYKDPVTGVVPAGSPDKVILKMGNSYKKEALLQFLSEYGLTPLAEYPVTEKSPDGVVYTGSQDHKVIVSKSALYAISKTMVVPVNPGDIAPTADTPSYWGGIEDLPPAPPNVETLKTLHERKDLGRSGARVTFDGGKVEGMSGRVKRFKDSKGVYYLKQFKLRRATWKALNAALEAQPAAERKWKETNQSQMKFFVGEYNAEEDCLEETGAYSDAVTAKKFVFPEGEVYFVADSTEYTYEGSLYLKIRKPGPLFASVHTLLNKIQPGFGTEVLKPPTQDEMESRKLFQLLWSFDPQRHDKLANTEPTIETFRKEVAKASAALGYSMTDLERIEEREVYPDRNALVLPGRWKKLAKGRIWFLVQTAKDTDAIVSVAQMGLAGIHERNLAGVPKHGTSYESDVSSGSGDSSLCTVVAENSGSLSSANSWGPYGFLIHPDALDRLDSYMYYGDKWGRAKGSDWDNRKSLEVMCSKGGLEDGQQYNEIMLRTGIALDKILRFYGSSESIRKDMIKALRNSGVESIRGVPVEDFVVCVTDCKACYEKYVKPLVV